MTNKFLHYSKGLARIPSPAMADGITTQNETIDLSLAIKQHANYIAALRDLGIDISVLAADSDYPDSHFVEDTAVICQQQAVLTKPGASARRGEVQSMQAALSALLPVRELNATDEAMLDGGDVLWFGKNVLIGISDRTNLAGARGLANELHAIDHQLAIHFVEFSGVLHLKSGLVALNDEVLLGNPRMQLKTPLTVGKIIWLPEEEAYAANSLIANGAAFVFAECTKTQAIVEKVGLKAIPLDMSEFRKMDGSFTCLSLLW